MKKILLISMFFCSSILSLKEKKDDDGNTISYSLERLRQIVLAYQHEVVRISREQRAENLPR